MLLQSITLASNDLNAARAFYHTLLQFPVRESSNTQLIIAVGRSELRFVKHTHAAFYHFAFLIPANQLHGAYAWVASKTDVLPFTPQTKIADFKNWNAEAFYFHDYNQNIVEFIVHHDLQNPSEKLFCAASVLSLCEIGIPVHSVTDACDYFNNKYHIPFYHKGPRLPDFAVMGDEEGLLIVTTIGRGWLPTQRPAERHYLDIAFVHNGVSARCVDADLPK